VDRRKPSATMRLDRHWLAHSDFLDIVIKDLDMLSVEEDYLPQVFCS